VQEFDCLTEIAGMEVDLQSYFVPECLTPLAYCPIYRELPSECQRRYNQLHGLYVNEQIGYFESGMARFVRALTRSLPRASPVCERLHRLVEEERHHASWFARYNLQAAPEYYSKGPNLLVRVNPAVEWMIGGIMSLPHRFPFFLWVLLILEERASHLSQTIIANSHGLEPNYIRLHTNHLRDEAQHVALDKSLISDLWDRYAPITRHLNAWLFKSFFQEFLHVPKRSAFQVVEILLREYPILASHRSRLRLALQGLRGNREFLASLYNRSSNPVTFDLFDRYTEFRSLTATLDGYARAA
jgi:hypothetical protein